MKHFSLASLTFLALASTFASATVTVTRVPTTGTSATVTSLGGGVYDVELLTTVNAQPTTFTISGDTTDAIRHLTVDAATSQTTILRIHGPTSSQSIVSVDSIGIGSSTSTVVLDDLRTSGNVGSITVHTIDGPVIGGDVTGDITLPQRTGGGQSTLIRMDIAGDLLGDVDASYGSITELFVTGDIGTSGTHRSIVAGDNIFNIEAASIYADISTGAGDFVQRIRTTSGDFAGSLTTASLTFSAGYSSSIRGIIIAGDLDADLHFTSGIFDPISIDGSLNGDIDIDTAGNLKGQIIINRANSSGTWSGDVIVGSTTLSPKGSYTQTGVGTRAVGLAPFQCHREDCSPAHLSTVSTTWNASTDRVRLRHYGPITWSGMPVAVSWCDNGDDCTPGSNDDTSNWLVEAGLGTRTLSLLYFDDIEPSVIPPVREYRIIPILAGQSALRCAGLLASGDVPVEDFEYTFFTP